MDLTGPSPSLYPVLVQECFQGETCYVDLEKWINLNGQKAIVYSVSDTVPSTYTIAGSWVEVPTSTCGDLHPSVEVRTAHCLYAFTGFTVSIYCTGVFHFAPRVPVWTLGNCNEDISLTILDLTNTPVPVPMDKLWGSLPATYDRLKAVIHVSVGSDDIRLRIYALKAGNLATGFVDIRIIPSFSVSLLTTDQCVLSGNAYQLDLSKKTVPTSSLTPYLRYTATAPVTIHLLSGLLTYATPPSDFTFTYTVTDPFSNQVTDTVSVTVLPSILLIKLPPDKLLAYDGIPWTAAIAASGGSSVPSVTVNLPFIHSSGNVEWTSPSYASISPLKVTATDPKCSSAAVSFTAVVSVLRGLPPEFRPFDGDVMLCYAGKPWSVQLPKYLFHLYFPANQLSTSLIASPVGVVIDPSLTLSWASPTAGLLTIDLKSCSPEQYCASKTYTLPCLSPISIFLNDLPTHLYIGQELHELSPHPVATVWQSGIQTFDIASLYLTLPKPDGLLMDRLGALWWRPQTAAVFTFTISAELKGSPAAGKGYIGVSGAYSVEVRSNAVPTLRPLSPLEAAQRCFVSLITDNCVLDIVAALQPRDADNDLITCDCQAYPVSSNILTWDRSAESTLSPSHLIRIRCKDSHSAYVLSLPFRIYPDFQPLISDFSPNDLTARVGFLWSRSFTISAGGVQYPSDSSKVKSLTVSPSVVTFSAPGVLVWNPAIGLEGTSVEITINVVWIGTKDVPVSRSYTVSVDSQQPQVPICTDLSISEKTIAINAVSSTFSLDLNTKCSSPVSHSLQYTLIKAPTGLVLSGNTVNWTPVVPEDREQVVIAVKDTVYSQEIGTIYRFDLIPRCDFSFSLPLLRATPGESYKSRVQVDSFCAVYMSISDFIYTMSVSGPNLTPPIPIIDPNYGIITWEVPTDPSYIGPYTLSITLTQIVALSDPANTKSASFALLLDPRITLGVPVSSASTDTVTEWSAAFHCQTSVSSTSFKATSTSLKFAFSAGTLKYAPTVGEYASELVTLSCSDGVRTALYSLVISPVEQVTPPVCVPQAFTVTEDQYNSGTVAWTDVDSFPRDMKFTLQGAAPSGFSLHSWGSYDYTPTQGGLETVAIQVSDGLSDVIVSVDFTIVEVNDLPYLAPVPTQVIDRLQSQTFSSFSLSALDEETGSLLVHYSYSDALPNDLAAGVLPMDYTWSPEADISYRKATFWVEDGGGLLSPIQSVLLCQGVECRVRPEITKVETTNPACTQLGNSLSCQKTTPEQLVLLQVSGYNLGTAVYVAYRECEFVSISASPTDPSFKTITCELPYPPPVGGSKAFMYGETGGWTGFAKDLVSYILPPTPVLIAYLQAGQILALYDSGTCSVPVHGVGLSPHCSCFASIDGTTESVAGLFVYLGSAHSTCDLLASSLTPGTTYYIRLNCGYLGATVSTQLPFVYYSLNLIPGPSPVLTGHNHGGYSIPIEVTGLSVCFEDLVLVAFMGYAIKPVGLCDDRKAQIVIPPYEAAWGTTTIVVRLSANGGLTYTEDANSMIFTYTGICPAGTFALAALCSPCPPGHYCPPNHSNYYLLAPIPCDLGSYQPSSSQTACILCEPGYQCFCKALTAHIPCDAGFVCDSFGIIRRAKPCPPGYYCKAGTSRAVQDLTSTDLPDPIPCPQDTYCKIGAYQSKVNTADPYTPQPCGSGFFCPKGSSNSLVRLT